MTTVTEIYSRLHRALMETARDSGIQPQTARLVLAVKEAGGRSTTDVLQRALCYPDGTVIRRALVEARNSGLLAGGDRRGSRVPIDITAGGQQLASQIAARARGAEVGA